jgi:hypothetical protein
MKKASIAIVLFTVWFAAAVVIVDHYRDNRKTKDPAYYYADKNLELDRYTLLVNIVVAAFTLGLLLYTRNSIIASDRNAKNALDAVAASNLAYIDNERGKMIVRDRVIDPDFTGIGFAYQNIGKGVATLKSFMLGFKVLPTRFAAPEENTDWQGKTFEFPVAANDWFTTETIGHIQATFQGLNVAVPEDIRTAAIKGGSRIVVYSKLDYETMTGDLMELKDAILYSHEPQNIIVWPFAPETGETRVKHNVYRLPATPRAAKNDRNARKG